LIQVQITCPFEKTEAVYDFLLDNVGVKSILKFSADNAHVLQFRIPDDEVLETMEKLKSRGVGVEFGFIDILDLKASLPREIEESSETRIQREAVLAVEEIYENVKSGASLSFDFLAFIVLAAVMAGIGLVQNNGTLIVASMLLSPLMGPMLGVALGYVVSDRNLFFKGTRNELIALLFSFAVGAILGVIVAVAVPGEIAGIENDVALNISTEIVRRGRWFLQPTAGFDVGVAIFSGAAVAVSVTKGDMSALVGVAISAALMPPAVNVGMMLALGVGSPIMLEMAAGSLSLLVMNIVMIDIAAIVMFRIKKLTPISNKSATWRAVTQFRTTKSQSLYHTAATEVPSPAATFTPAEPAKEPDPPTDEGEVPEKSEE
jgi:uncharacterized hydrophobic protein (TIGR00271 family)